MPSETPSDRTAAIQSSRLRLRREIKRIVAAYEGRRDGFCLARWLRARHVEAYVIHPASVAVSREHRRAKTDSPRHGTADARLSRLAARREAPLQHGGDL
jgi:hypothetical protein